MVTNKLFYSAVIGAALLFAPVKATTYYVSSSGGDSNDGRSPDRPWKTIAYAVSLLQAGDTAFVKAGDYGSEQITFPRAGSSGRPIVVQGYHTTPRDIPARTYAVGDSKLDASVMPLLSSVPRTGTAITIGRNYVAIKNIQVVGYRTGVMVTGNSNTLDNVTAIYQNPDRALGYYGLAINIQGDYNGLTNCLVADWTVEGLMLYGDHNTADSCACYATTSSAQYPHGYYLMAMGSYNTVRKCFSHRVVEMSHGGHGMGCKATSQYNTFIDCNIRGFWGDGYMVAHRGCAYNRFIRCVARDGVGFVVRDSAHDNTFEECRSYNAAYYSNRGAIVTWQSGEDGTIGVGANNLFVNCIFEKASTMILHLNVSNTATAFFSSNKFINCNFIGATNFYRTETPSQNNQFINCVITNISNISGGGTYGVGYSYANGCFFGNGFAAPTGSGNIAANPLFVDGTNGDFRLQSHSPCINAGTADLAPSTDLDGNTRPQGQGYDIGAYEFLAPATPAVSRQVRVRAVRLESTPVRYFDLRGRQIVRAMSRLPHGVVIEAATNPKCVAVLVNGSGH